MIKNLCDSCRHAGTDLSSWCSVNDGETTICHQYEFHITKDEVKELEAENAELKAQLEEARNHGALMGSAAAEYKDRIESTLDWINRTTPYKSDSDYGAGWDAACDHVRSRLRITEEDDAEENTR